MRLRWSWFAHDDAMPATISQRSVTSGRAEQVGRHQNDEARVSLPRDAGPAFRRYSVVYHAYQVASAAWMYGRMASWNAVPRALEIAVCSDVELICVLST